MSKKKNINKKFDEKLLPIKCEEKSLVVLESKEKGLLVINNSKELIMNVAKKLSIALIGTISIMYIVILTLVATSVFYVSNLKNGLIQKRSLCKWNKCSSFI